MESDTQSHPRTSLLNTFLGRSGRPRSSLTPTSLGVLPDGGIPPSLPSAPIPLPGQSQAQAQSQLNGPGAAALNAGHRRRPATSVHNNSNSTTPAPSSSVPTQPSGGQILTQMLRRRRSGNGPLTNTANVAPSSPLPVTNASPALQTPSHRIRLVPHLENARSLHFDPIIRDCREGAPAIRIGRFTERSGSQNNGNNNTLAGKIAFKSKVVSRGHAELWCEANGKFFIKDTSSSSGTFLNHMRLANAGNESRPFMLKDGDILQLGVDYQGGTEEIYRCVKIRVEIGREWQSAPNAFNTSALAQLRSLSSNIQMPSQPSSTSITASATIATTANGTALARSKTAVKQKTSVGDCCICLFPVTVCQALFIAPCSHSFHYKCIRMPLLDHHPGFICPLCRSFHDLEADVEIDLPEASDEWQETGAETEEPDMLATTAEQHAIDGEGDLVMAAGNTSTPPEPNSHHSANHSQEDDLPLQTAAEDNGRRVLQPLGGSMFHSHRTSLPPPSAKRTAAGRRITIVPNHNADLPPLPVEAGESGAGAETDMDMEDTGRQPRTRSRSRARSTIYNLVHGGGGGSAHSQGHGQAQSGSNSNLPVAVVPVAVVNGTPPQASAPSLPPLPFSGAPNGFGMMPTPGARAVNIIGGGNGSSSHLYGDAGEFGATGRGDDSLLSDEEVSPDATLATNRKR